MEQIVWSADGTNRRRVAEFVRVFSAFVYHYQRCVMGPNFRMGA